MTYSLTVNKHVVYLPFEIQLYATYSKNTYKNSIAVAGAVDRP